MTVKDFSRIAVVVWLIPWSLTVQASIIDFDAFAPGTPVATIDGVTFTSNISTYALVASTGFETTSGANYLGVDDGSFEVFFPGDVVTLTFADPITRLTANFISSPGTPGGAFSIETVLGSTVSGQAPDSVLGDDGEVFSVSFSSSVPFIFADLSSPVAGLYSYNIDDISFTPVPLPSALALLGTGLLPVFGFRCKRFADDHVASRQRNRSKQELRGNQS